MLPNSATGTHQRIRVQRVNQTNVPEAIILHGTLVPGTYEVDNGVFSLALDAQGANDSPLHLAPDSITKNLYLDQNGLEWNVISN